MNYSEEIKMFFEELKKYIPQIIGIFGTLLGTTVGWLLKYLQDNVGKTTFSVKSFENYKDKNDQYAYVITLFICNHSLKPKYITNIEIKFLENKRELFCSSPRIANKSDPFMSISKNSKISTVNLNFNIPEHICICDLICKNELRKIQNANKIVFTYEDAKGRKKKFHVKKDFSITKVEAYNKGATFPCG